MKKYILLSVILLSMAAAFAQPKKKPAAKEKPPTKQEMDDMMKEMEKALGELDPEQKKAMDSMGIKMPDMKKMQKGVAGMTDAQLKKAWEDEDRIVPEKDVARINAAMATKLNNADVSAFINKTHLSVLSQLIPTTKAKGAELVKELLQQKISLANTAAGLWIDGKPTLALYLMGEACKAEPSNTNYLNNYASMLTMCGAEELALPILYNLNTRHPQNSTLLNNIAQAWLGLGELPRATKYADSTIRIYATHPQANMLICVIEESKGNIPAAIAAARKSIKESFSDQKAQKLKKLGHDLKGDDIHWEHPINYDLLGLTKFTWPEYPLDVEQNKAAEAAWAEFKASCREKITALKIKQQRLEQEFVKISTMRNQQVMQAAQSGQYVQLIPGHAAKAIAKFGYSVNDINGNASFVFAQEMDPLFRARTQGAEKNKLLAEKQALIDKKYEDQVGEGRPNPLEQICKDENAIRTEFLKDANGRLQTAYRQYLHYVNRRTGELLYFLQYTQWPEQFELSKVNAQISWLTQISDQNPYFVKKSSWCVNVPKKNEKSDSLQNFDDVACKYVSTMNLGVFKIISSCSNLSGEFDFKAVKINIKDNVETGKYSGTVIMGISEKLGPMYLQGKATLGGLVEFDNTGITDMGVVAGVGVKAGPVNIASVNTTITFNTGVTNTTKFLGQR